MTPRELIGVAEVPGGPPLRLVRRGRDHIMLDRNEVMSSRMSGSEVAIGEMSCQRLAGRAAPRVLIGGYGMGFTLRAVLERLPAAARVTVAELVPGIIDWARGPLRALTGDCLDDPRVEVRIEDVAETIRDGGWDAILLDVDNGPDGLTRSANDRLYSAVGLVIARAGLRPGGVLAVWSAGSDAKFVALLERAGFEVEEVRIRARANGKGPLHFLWFATAGRAAVGAGRRGLVATGTT